MITRCPECGTKFKISVDLIRAEDSTVRCGDCLSVFDARAQLVDEAAESIYLTSDARERAARLRAQREADLQQQSARVKSEEYASECEPPPDGSESGSHGTGWVNSSFDRKDNADRGRLASGQLASRPQQRGQMVIDRRESVADINLDHADTIAYQPIRGHAADSPAPMARRRVEQVQPMRGSQHSASKVQAESDVATLDVAQGNRGSSQGPGDHSNRIDPLINPDDKAIDFEQTVSLAELTGVEPEYTSGVQENRQRSLIGKPNEAVSESAPANFNRENTDRENSYVGEHQFGASVPPPSATEFSSETRESRSWPRTQETFTREGVESDIGDVDQPIGRPRSERHLADHSQRYERDAYGASSEQRYKSAGNKSEHYSLDSTDASSDRSESASAMRQHINERGVSIDTNDGYDEPSESQSNALTWALLALLVVACAVALYSRADIAKSNLPLSVRAAFCSVAGCELPVAVNIADLELLRQKVYSHPSIEGALVVSIDVVNNALFPQPYPVLSITMANSNGESVAQRDFAPLDYIENYAATETLTAGKPTRINIEIVDPGTDAQSFEMEFRQQ